MSRFLFVVPPLVGHLNPARAVAAELAAAGHQVGWVGSQLALRPLLGEQAVIYKTGSRIHRPQADQGLASIRSLWQQFIVPYTKFTLPTVQKAVADFGPDVIVCDQHTPAGALVAHRNRLSWATLACSSIELLRPWQARPAVEAWIGAQLDAIWDAADLPAGERFDPRFSPELVLSFSTAELTGPLVPPDPHTSMAAVRQVGPCFGPRAEDPDFDVDWIDDRQQLVLITMGTLAAELADGFYARAAAALAPLAGQVQAVLVAPTESIPDPPANVLVRPRVPMLKLLPRASAVISHGGFNTVSESLAHELPLVLAPIRHDQPINADLVTAAGAGLRVPFVRVSPDQLRNSLCTVLSEPSYRDAAARIAATFRAAGGAPAAALHLERLANPMSITNHQPSYRLTDAHV
ncbi:MAG: glycosyltransferase [Jatrophihabitantaceae bacterium]